MAKHGVSKGVIASAVLAGLLAVGLVAYLIGSKPDAAENEPVVVPDSSKIAFKGPNKPPPVRKRPRPKPRPRPQPKPKPEVTKASEETAPTEETVPPDETPPPGEEPLPREDMAETGEVPAEPGESEPSTPETESARVIENQLFSLKLGSVRPVTAAPSIAIPQPEAEAVTTPLVTYEGDALVEISLTLTPKSGDEIVLEGLALGVGDEAFAPVQAKLFGRPYLAPSTEMTRMSPEARIILAIGAAEELIEPVADGGTYVELFMSRTDRPAAVPVTVLFAVPSDAQGDSALILGTQEIPVTIGR
jgi:hypothetical protein